MTPPTLLDRIRRIRPKLAGWLFSLAGRLDESYDVWLDDAPRKTHQPGDDEYPDPFTDYATLRALWSEALLSYSPPDPIPAGGWRRLMPGTDESDRIFAGFVARAFPEHRP
jgi:hypothetical protein